jgi:hypothetical protein
MAARKPREEEGAKDKIFLSRAHPSDVLPPTKPHLP